MRQHILQTPDGTEDLTQVLTDLCNVSGPWSRVLRTLRDELVRSVYSDYYAMEQQGLLFSQLPYYKAAERLEADNKHLLQEKEAFKKLLLQRQVLHTIFSSLSQLALSLNPQHCFPDGFQNRHTHPYYLSVAAPKSQCSRSWASCLQCMPVSYQHMVTTLCMMG